MLAMSYRSSITPELTKAVKTAADTESSALPTRQQVESREAWQNLLDRTLMIWLRDPSELEDLDIEPPSKTILRLALDYAEKFRDDGLPCPNSIVSDPNGGIVFERRLGNVSEVFHFWDDGTAEYQQFRGTNLVIRGEI